MIKPSDRLDIEKSRYSDAYIRKHNMEWYYKFYFFKEGTPIEESGDDGFVLGRLYTFIYDDPKYKETLDFYSEVPVSLFMGYSKKAPDNPMMLNIHFIPPQIRAEIFDKIFAINIDTIESVSESISKGRQDNTAIKAKYNDLMKHLDKSGFGFAIRSYIPERIKTEPMIISYSDWWRLLTFSNQHLEKKGVMEIYRMYKQNLDVNWKPFTKEKKINL